MNFLLILAGIILLAGGAEGLVRGTSVALRLGVTLLVVGLTIVAFGTGSPELVVSVGSALNGNSGLAMGNVIGSNISNIDPILGSAAVIRPLKVRAEIVRRQTPIMVVITGILWLLLYDGEFSRLEGALLTIGAVIYPILTYYLSKQKRTKGVEDEFEEAYEKPKSKVCIDFLFIVIGLAFLVLGANLHRESAVNIAKYFGVSDVVIGLTIVAIGTSLPELATSTIAAKNGDATLLWEMRSVQIS